MSHTSGSCLASLANHSRKCLTPGPSDYNPNRHQPSGCRANAVLRSHSPQRLPPPTAYVPGVGSYDPNDDAVLLQQPTATVSKVGRDARHVGDYLHYVGSETGPAIGPGAYNPELANDGRPATVAGQVLERSREGWPGWTFVSDTVRNIFAFLLPEERGAEGRYVS